MFGFREGNNAMTMDKSLRMRRGLVRSRSVLTRAERLARLQEADLWKAGDSPLGLPKVRVFKLAIKKKKKKKEEGEEGAEGTAAAAAPAPEAKKADAKKSDSKKK
jgi:small basic protein (TIGR04137 family)